MLPKQVAWATIPVFVFAIFVWPTPYDYRHAGTGPATRTNRISGVSQVATGDGWRTEKEIRDAADAVAAKTDAAYRSDGERLARIVRPMLASIHAELLPNSTTLMRFYNPYDIGPGLDVGGVDSSPAHVEYWLYDPKTFQRTKFLCYGPVGSPFYEFSGGIQLVPNGFTIIRYGDLKFDNVPELQALRPGASYMCHVVWTIKAVEYLNRTVNVDPPIEITGDLCFTRNRAGLW